MKHFYNFILSLVILLAGNTVSAQVVYNITSNTTWNSSNIKNLFPTTQQNTYVVNIAPGISLTINSGSVFNSTTFTGGGELVINSNMDIHTNYITNVPVKFQNINIVLNANLVLNGYASFSNTSLTASNYSKITVNYLGITIDNSNWNFNNNAELLVNGPLEIDRTAFVFNNNSKLTGNHTMNLSTTTIRLNNNAQFFANGQVTLKENSLINIGDGEFNSKANFYMNAGLNIYQNSMVFIANKNNYFGSWNMVNLDGGKTFQPYQSEWNTINCGSEGPNPCMVNRIYGPLGITSSGPKTASSLPVKLTNFEVKSMQGRNILTWATQQEENSEKFIILKSTDGSKWNTIGEVKAAGNSSIKINYEYSDYNPLAAKQFYRLKIVDLDGSIEYSEIRQIGGNNVSSVTVFPNPATDYIRVSTGSSANNNLSIQLINSSGKVLEQKKVSDSGSVTSFSMSNYTSGLYIIRVIHQSGNIESFKVLVNK